uniref:Uncharacterized protein n=1 Tax=viral metagenome TaxID=1070528 RepID=A0A6C0D9T7_9ZZZZ
MLNFLVETKQEYTTQLINIITPIIYDGLQSIYSEVVHISTSDNILKNFQTFMKRIPKWNNEIIQKETNRIMNNTKSYTWLEDLIRATIKSNIIVLTYNPSFKNQVKVDPKLYQDIKIDDFIHKIYIECARELWNNPYLFYHNYPPIELKRNQRDSILLIKDCIREAIRKLLPVKHILNIYLGEEMEVGEIDDHFENSISEIEGKNLNKLVHKDLYNKFSEQIDKSNNEPNKLSEKIEDKHNNKLSEKIEDKHDNKLSLDLSNMKISETSTINNKHTATNETVGAKILGIINNNDINLSDNKTSELQVSNNTNNIDTKIKKVLEKDLNDSETSISINPDQKYNEVFSNSVNKEEIQNSMTAPSKDKAKFFANYLRI